GLDDLDELRPGYPVEQAFQHYKIKPMRNELYQFGFEIYDSSSELNEEDLALLQAAQRATANAYAPYSDFSVGAAAMLVNGEIVTGSNQENVSFPAGLCAERVAL